MIKFAIELRAVITDNSLPLRDIKKNNLLFFKSKSRENLFWFKILFSVFLIYILDM